MTLPIRNRSSHLFYKSTAAGFGAGLARGHLLI